GQIRLGGVHGLQQMKQPKPDTPEQQFIDEYLHKNPKAGIAEAVRAYTDATQRPPQSLVLVPNAETGCYTAQTARPGASIAPGAVTASQAGSLNVPTTQQRNVAAQAQLVTEQMPGLIKEIQQNANLLGPIAGQWNAF